MDLPDGLPSSFHNLLCPLSLMPACDVIQLLRGPTEQSNSVDLLSSQLP